MKRGFIDRITAGLTIPVLIFILAVVSVEAYAGANVPVTIDIPLTYIVRGNDSTAGGDVFVLTPDDPLAPMPEDASNGKKTIKVTGEGSYSFGQIYYDRPEVWWYTVTRELTEKKGVTKDDSVYRAKVIALNDGHGYVLVYRKGSDKKSELVYTDRVAPDTGNMTMLPAYTAVAFAAAAALVLMIIYRWRKRS